MLGIDISAVSIKKQENLFLYICLVVFICTALPASILGWFLGYKYMHPLVALKKRIAEISVDNLEQSAKTYKNDEIGGIISEFDKMSLNLSQSINKVKKSQEELEYFKKIVDYSINAVGMSTPEGKHFYQNRAFDELFGLAIEEIQDKSGPWDTVYVDKNIGHKVFTTVKAGKPWIGEVKMYGRDRKVMDVYLKAYSIKNPQNKVIGLIGLHSDITDLKKYEEKQKDNEEKYHTLFEATDAAVYIMDGSEFIECNSRSLEVFGCKGKEELLNIPPWAVSPEKQPDGKDSMKEALKNIKKAMDGTPHTFYWKHCRKDGTPFDAEVSLRRIFLRNKSYLQAMITDITERKKYEILLKETNAEIDNAHKHGIYMLAEAAEYKDKDTGSHIKNIAQITTKLALEMGVEAEQAEQMGWDSILHDLGKLGISDSILLKPDRLTEDEFEIIKKHTLIGAKIIGDDKWFIQARQIAISHHEKWNGSGYPEGLKGNDIPFVARIVAVADVFDALISERPYKKSWSLKKAVEEIERESGKHFDPKIIKAFLSLYRKGKLERFCTILNKNS